MNIHSRWLAISLPSSGSSKVVLDSITVVVVSIDGAFVFAIVKLVEWSNKIEIFRLNWYDTRSKKNTCNKLSFYTKRGQQLPQLREKL